MFRSLGQANLAALALIAALYHTFNHAIFKGLLFLGAGSVVQATHTRNMEKMGGLIRLMPVTAVCFLVGAVAISGLPPLNGFVSEWLTYQALLAGFGTTQSLTRLMFPIAGSLLALTAALAAACFVKAFAIPFLALPRSEEAANAREASLPMRAGMAVLAAGCVALGLGATWFVRVFDPITQQALGVRASSALVTAHGMALSPGTPHGGTISTAGMALLFLLAGAAFALPLALRWRRRSVTGPVWDCGLPGLTADNEYTATAFSKPLRMIFSVLYRPRREIQAEYEVSPHYPSAIRFESEIERTFEKRLYGPLRERIMAAANRMKGIQAGSINLYLAYIFITLILLLLFGVRG
jgi:hydrogenase-4 component B